MKNELEELSFRYLEPQTYESLRAKVDAKRRATEGFIEELKTTITAKLEEAQVPVIEIDGRIKRLWSINQKLRRQKIELDQVYDFIALRIITEGVKECYATLGIIHELGEVFSRNNDRQNTVLKAIIIEDIGKARRDDAADSKIEKRPGSMFARGAATEIIFRDKYFGFAIGRLVQDELGIFGSILLVAEFGEKPAAQTGALDCFQILFRDDHVGIDIADVERRRDTGKGCEFFHVIGLQPVVRGPKRVNCL